jgi:hypothetical protein
MPMRRVEEEWNDLENGEGVVLGAKREQVRLKTDVGTRDEIMLVAGVVEKDLLLGEE